MSFLFCSLAEKEWGMGNGEVCVWGVLFTIYSPFGSMQGKNVFCTVCTINYCKIEGNCASVQIVKTCVEFLNSILLRV